MKKTLLYIAFLVLLVPSVSLASFDTSLKYGSRGDAVSDLQDFLQDNNYYSGKVDGKFGLGTFTGVKNFQQANGLAVDGYFGRASRSKASDLLSADLQTSDDAEQAETGTISAPVVTMPGCTSTAGFSITTGHPCDGSTPSPVTDAATQAKLDALTKLQQQLVINTTPVVAVTPPPVQPVTHTYTFDQVEFHSQQNHDDNAIQVNRGTVTMGGTSNYLEIAIAADGGTSNVDTTLKPILSITSSDPTVFPEQDIILTDTAPLTLNIGGLSKTVAEYFEEPAIVPADGHAVPGTYTLTLNAPALNLSRQVTVTLEQAPGMDAVNQAADNTQLANQIAQQVRAKYPNSTWQAFNTLSNGKPGMALVESPGSTNEVAEIWYAADGTPSLHWTDGTPN